MKNEAFLDHMRRSVEEWKQASYVTPEILERYDHFLLEIEKFRDMARHFDSEKSVMMNAVLNFANSALKSLFLINTGGVFVVMMAVSAIVSKDSKYTHLLAPLAKECSYFVWGIVASVISVCFAYLAQRTYTANMDAKVGDRMNWLAIIAAGLSLAAFIAGAVSLRDVFLAGSCPGN